MQRPTQLISLVQIRYFFVVVQGKYVIMLWRGGINRINTILGLVDVPKIITESRDRALLIQKKCLEM